MTYAYNATVENWVDGDTVDMLVDLGFRTVQSRRFQLFGVNTPERGREGWKEATEFCAKHVPPGMIVTVSTMKDRRQRYGKYYVDIKLGGTTLSQMLVEANLGVPVPA